MTPRLVILACAVAAAALLCGCGSEAEEAAPPALPPRPDLGAVEPAVRRAIEEVVPESAATSVEALRRYAMVLHAHAFFEPAARVYEIAAARAPDAWRDLYLAARALYGVDADRCRALFERSRARNARYQTTHLWLGRIYLEGGDLDAALASYEAANRIGVSLFAHVGAARVYMSEGPRRDLRKAKAHLDQARALGRRTPDVYIALARYHRIVRNSRLRIAAERLARDEIERFGFPDPLMREVSLLAVSREGLRRQIAGLVNQGDFELALQRAEALIAQDPESDDARHFKANVLLRMGRHAEVEALASDILSRRPDDQDLMVLRANALHDLGRVPEALEQLRISFEKGEAHVGTRYTYGTLLGPVDAEAARRHLEWVLETAPLRHPETRLLLARIYEVLGRKPDAVRMLEGALEFDPTDEDARRRLGEIGG